MSDRRQVLLCRYFQQAIQIGVPEYLCVKAYRVWANGARTDYDFKVLNSFDRVLADRELSCN